MSGGGNVSNHGLLAGLGAGAAGVLVVGGLSLLLIRKQLSAAMTAAVWTVVAALVLAVLAGAVYVALLILHKHRQLAGAQAESQIALAQAALPQISPPQISPPQISPPQISLHLPEGISAEAAAALARGLSSGEAPALEQAPVITDAPAIESGAVWAPLDRVRRQPR